MKNNAPGLALAAATLALAACAAQPPPEPSEPEIPSREEVAEVTRRELPASEAAIAAVKAYKLRVCAEKPETSRGSDPPAGRGCRIGYNPARELSILENLLETEPGAPDAPRILERMIALWADLDVEADRECARFAISSMATNDAVEKAQQTLYTLEKIHQNAQSEPPKLCARLRNQYPSHAVLGACRAAGDSPAPPTGDGWF